MAQIPLERTIGDTYRFALSNVLSIFGIVWFPILLLAAAAAAGVWWLWPDIAGMDWSAHADAARSQEAAMRFVFKAFAVAGPFYILFYVLIAMMNVGVQRKALGLVEGPVFFYFSLEGTVWRFLGAMILAVILIYMGMALTVGAVAAVFWAGAHFGLPALYGLVEFAAVVAGICWFFYMAVRLMFFLPAVVVAEGGLGLARSWELGAGNFWRMVALFVVCIFAPMMAISMVSNIIVLPFMMSVMIPLQQAADAHQVVTPQQLWAEVGPALRWFVPLFAGLQILSWVVVLGLQNAMSACAYRNIVAPEPASDIEPPLHPSTSSG
jgi:hypothetical protein